MTHIVLGVILIQILISFQIGSIQSAPLSSYLVSSFTPPDSDFNLPFNHIAINSITGDIYIGARERLYQLDSDMNLKETVDTRKCSFPNEDRFNDNKLLLSVVTPQNYTLITCGGCGGDCQIRNLANISLDVRYPANTGDVVERELSTVAVVALGADFERNENGTLDGPFLFNGKSRESGINEQEFISKRSLVNFQSTQEIPGLNVKSSHSSSFKHLISYNDHLYYFIVRGEETYLGRICRDSPDDDFASYTEIELQCGHEGSHDGIQSAYIGPAGSEFAESMNISTEDGVLYAIFSSTSSSSLCVYTMINVQQSFEDAILGCIQGTGTGIANSFMSDVINSGGSKCEKIGILSGTPVHLTVNEDIQPVIRPARTVPESLKEAVKSKLDQLQDQGIIEGVDEPTDWVSQMSVAQKKSGKIRICIDPRPLNEALKREHYSLPVLDDVLPCLSKQKPSPYVILKMVICIALLMTNQANPLQLLLPGADTSGECSHLDSRYQVKSSRNVSINHWMG
nr:plexin-B2-like [Lytechinus pictus]